MIKKQALCQVCFRRNKIIFFKKPKNQKTANIYGAIFMALSMLGYISNDTIIKYFASNLPVSQTIFIRGIFVTALIYTLCLMQKAFKQSIRKKDLPLVIIRSITDLCATILFLTALFNMPLANASAILQTLPLTVTLMGAIVLGEKFGVYRTFAILFGFLGALLIIKPGALGFNGYSLFAIAAVLFITTREIITRRISPESSTLLISLITASSITFVGGIGGAFLQTWVEIPITTFVGLMIASIFIFIAYYFSIPAMQFGEISFVSPFRFTLMFWAIIFGFIFFNEVPDQLTVLGLFIVISAGTFTYLRTDYYSNRK